MNYFKRKILLFFIFGSCVFSSACYSSGNTSKPRKESRFKKRRPPALKKTVSAFSAAQDKKGIAVELVLSPTETISGGRKTLPKPVGIIFSSREEKKRTYYTLEYLSYDPKGGFFYFFYEKEGAGLTKNVKGINLKYHRELGWYLIEEAWF